MPSILTEGLTAWKHLISTSKYPDVSVFHYTRLLSSASCSHSISNEICCDEPRKSDTDIVRVFENKPLLVGFGENFQYDNKKVVVSSRYFFYNFVFKHQGIDYFKNVNFWLKCLVCTENSTFWYLFRNYSKFLLYERNFKLF